MRFLHLSTDKYNKLKEFLDTDKWITLKIVEAKYIQGLDIWEVTFDKEVTGMDGFYLGQHI